MYSLSQKESDSVSILRVIFTVMVVYIHVHVGAETIISSDHMIKYIEYAISEVICRCAVPGFFLISSIMLYKKTFTWRSNIKKKLSTILVPYIIMNSFWIIFFLITKKIDALSQFFVSESSDIYNWGIKEWLNAYLGFDGLPVLGQTWFLRDLFVINLLSVILKKIIDKIPEIWLIFISVIWFFNIQIPILFISNSTVFFFSLGYYVVKYGLHLHSITNVHKRLLYICYFLFVILDIVIRIISNNNTILVVITNIIHSTMIVFGVAFFALLALDVCDKNSTLDTTDKKRTKGKKLYMILLRYNFCIYLFHELTLTICRKVVLKIFGSTVFVQAAYYFILPIIVIAWCIFISVILERLCPPLFNLITGKRKKIMAN